MVKSTFPSDTVWQISIEPGNFLGLDGVVSEEEGMKLGHRGLQYILDLAVLPVQDDRGATHQRPLPDHLRRHPLSHDRPTPEARQARNARRVAPQT